MFTFIIVVAVAAFVPYVAAPGIANGVKAVSKPAAAMQFEPTLPATVQDSDAANRIVLKRRDSEAAS
ncbi:hypothetical protein [Paraburkholderia bryophila]|uniref:Uncharacterized protein n=1 Tax=Paraburkholderia bryophila TaxID=420952 RepID=A0A7Y9WRJ4_9BURK|nr:hypothetical protein [Paraburkholderia bryophila]NYH16492.1 hypothetical protein [Paraburkholderia bryophila]NYH25080.1 hypothetical protein [Paraburkholderia bryophila]